MIPKLMPDIRNLRGKAILTITGSSTKNDCQGIGS